MSAAAARDRDLFPSDDAGDDVGWKVFNGKEGVKVRYQEISGGALRIDFGDGNPVIATMQSRGKRGNPRYYLNHPQLGSFQQRGKQTFLAVLATSLRVQRLSAEIHREAATLTRLVTGAKEPVIPRKRNTLCTEPEPLTYTPRVIIPLKEMEAMNVSGPPFSVLPGWLSCRPEVTQGEKLVYGRMCTYAGKNGVAYPAEGTLAQEVGLSRRQVHDILSSLRNRNILRVTGRHSVSNVARYEFLAHPWLDEWVQEHRREEASLIEVGCELSSHPPVMRVHTPCEVSSHKKGLENRLPKEVVVVRSENSPLGTVNDDDDGLSLETLENSLRESGLNPEDQRRKWEAKSKKHDWDLNESGWRKWMIEALKRKPMPAKAKRANRPPDDPFWRGYLKNEVGIDYIAQHIAGQQMLDDFKAYRLRAIERPEGEAN
jgi:hypothetical protein